ncbi:MAG: translesion error-prone DNA polymerase V autoproteolytic subunit [Bacteroidales bacterium]|nr:translesion error-prone DNA polymerase V autoproteolytic subunit [Bacteroidales bacterium]
MDKQELVLAEGIHAGFPSPAQDYSDRAIDLNKELIRHPAATFFGRVAGDSMRDAGISEGDLLVIDRSLQPSDGDMVVCYLDGEFALKTLRFKEGRPVLYAANPQYKPIPIEEGSDFRAWGVVTYIVKNVRPGRL